MGIQRVLAMTALVAFAAFPASADMAKVEGDHYVNKDGMTLYSFDKDSAGVSTCYDTCAVNWPPLLADAGAKAKDGFTLVKRKDGSMQWAYDGKPMYLYIKDKKAGDKTGDGVGGTWHVAKAG